MPDPNRLSAREAGAAVTVIARREVAAYFDSSIAYVYAITQLMARGCWGELPV